MSLSVVTHAGSIIIFYFIYQYSRSLPSPCTNPRAGSKTTKIEEVLHPFKYCQLTNYHLFNTLESQIWTDLVAQTSTTLYIPSIQNNYFHSATFGNKSHSANAFMSSRLRCFLVLLNLTPWVSEKYVKVPPILNNPTPSFHKLTTTFLLMGFNNGTQRRGRRLPIFLRSHKEENGTTKISGIPALAIHPVRKNVMWENILRVVYTLTCSPSTARPAMGFKVEQFSMASTECAQGEIMCFRSIRKQLAHAGAQKDPRALGSAIGSF